MKAMFKITYRQLPLTSGIVFITENVIAASAAEAIRRTDAFVKAHYKGERLAATDVEMLGVDSVGKP